MNKISYRNLHFPASIFQHAVWLYARFNLSLRDVEEFLAERGIVVFYGAQRGATLGAPVDGAFRSADRKASAKMVVGERTHKGISMRCMSP